MSRLTRVGLYGGLAYAVIVGAATLVVFILPSTALDDLIGGACLYGFALGPIVHLFFGILCFLGLIRGGSRGLAALGMILNAAFAVVAGLLVIGFSAAVTGWR